MNDKEKVKAITTLIAAAILRMNGVKVRTMEK